MPQRITEDDVEISIRNLRFSVGRGNASCTNLFPIDGGERLCLTQESKGSASIGSIHGRDNFSDKYDEILAAMKERVNSKVFPLIRDKVLVSIARNFPFNTLFDEDNCTTPSQSYSIEGRVFGLETDEMLVLQNNGIDDLKVTSNGSFTFSTALGDGANYRVSVKEATLGQNRICEVEEGEGLLDGANVTNVEIICIDQRLRGARGGNVHIAARSLMDQLNAGGLTLLDSWAMEKLKIVLFQFKSPA